MRAEELALLLLSVVFLALVGARVLLAEVDAGTPAALDATGPWHYDRQSRYFSILPREARLFRSERPAQVADRVCQAMGGRLHYLRGPLLKTRSMVGFNCLFHETGPSNMTISADFGDLSRTPVSTE